MTWKHFLYDWPFVQGIHQLPVDSQHKGLEIESLDDFFAVTPNEWTNIWVVSKMKGIDTHPISP